MRSNVAKFLRHSKPAPKVDRLPWSGHRARIVGMYFAAAQFYADRADALYVHPSITEGQRAALLRAAKAIWRLETDFTLWRRFAAGDFLKAIEAVSYGDTVSDAIAWIDTLEELLGSPI